MGVTTLSSAIRDAKKCVRQTAFLKRAGGWLITFWSVAAPVLILVGIASYRRPEVVVVTAPDGLVPYRQITESDVAVAKRVARPGFLRGKENVVGHFPLQAMKKDEVVVGSSVSSRASSASEPGSRIITIPIKPIGKAMMANLPARIALVGSPKTGQTATFSGAATLLAVDDSKDVSATVAIAGADLDALLKVLSACDFYVVFGPK